MKSIILAATLVVACGFSSCSDNDREEFPDGVTYVKMIPKQVPVRLTDEQKDYVKANNEFAFNLFRQTNGKKESRIISPLGVSCMLGMLNDGADGGTATEIQDAMGMQNSDKASVNNYFSNLYANLPKVDPNVELNIANALFVDKSIKILSSFVKVMTTSYGAVVQQLDFSDPSAISAINKWCEKQTKGEVNNILDETSNDAFAYLLNAVFFKASWTDKFNSEDTRDETFTRENGTTVSLPMMNRQAKVLYTKAPNYSAICLPYSSGAFNMYVLLPDEGVSVDDVVSSLSAQGWEKQKEKMSNIVEDVYVNEDGQAYTTEAGRYIYIKIPRFTAVFNTDMTIPLQNMGINKAFTENAEFPFISDQKLPLAAIRQQTRIVVDEEGTKTAAVAASDIVTEAFTAPLTFYANSPFLYLIQENTSGIILFAGTYMGD